MGAKRLEDRVASILQRVERELDDAGGWGGRAGRWVGGWVRALPGGWAAGGLSGDLLRACARPTGHVCFSNVPCACEWLGAA